MNDALVESVRNLTKQKSREGPIVLNYCIRFNSIVHVQWNPLYFITLIIVVFRVSNNSSKRGLEITASVQNTTSYCTHWQPQHLNNATQAGPNCYSMALTRVLGEENEQLALEFWEYTTFQQDFHQLFFSFRKLPPNDYNMTLLCKSPTPFKPVF